MTALPAMIESAESTAVKWRAVERVPAGYLPMLEAIRRVKNSALWEFSKEPKAAWTKLKRLAVDARDDMVCPVLCERKLYIPPTLHPALHVLRVCSIASDDFASLSTGRRNRASTQLAALHDFEAFLRTPEGHTAGRVGGLEMFVERRATHYTFTNDKGERKTLDLSARSMQRWEVKERSGGLAALGEDGRGGYDREGQSQEAIDLYWMIRNDPRKYSMRTCWKRVHEAAKKVGWNWFENKHTCGAWDRKNRNERGLVLNREGEHAWTAKAAPYMEADNESFEPGECWESDHSTVNVWCRLANGKIVRAVITLIFDWRSRTVVGYRLVIVGNSESILCAFRDGARAYGLPRLFVMDNGKDFRSEIWTGGKPVRYAHPPSKDFAERTEGLFARLDVKPRWVTPYSPNSKARIERFFGTFDDQFCRAFASYCGNKPDNRPEAHARLVEKAVDFDQFASRLREWIATYNATPHSGEGMDGLSPLQVMALASTKRVLTDAQAPELLAAWPRPVKIHRNGVSIRIAGHRMNYGAYEPAIQRLAIGTVVRVSYDPDDLSAVSVWTMKGQFVCRAPENHRFNRAFTTEQHRETLRARARLKRAHREVRKAGLSAFADPVAQTIAAQALDSAERRLPDPVPPSGGPNLIPVQTDIDVASKPRQPLRKAVGAPDAISDTQRRFAEFAKRCETERKAKKPNIDPLIAWGRREAANA